MYVWPRNSYVSPPFAQPEPSSAGAVSKDGRLETFAVFDATHLHTTPTLHDMYDTVTRNLDKRRPEGTWNIETTTMYEPGADSVCELTFYHAQLIDEGNARSKSLLHDHRWADIYSLDKIKVDEGQREAPRDGAGVT